MWNRRLRQERHSLLPNTFHLATAEFNNPEMAKKDLKGLSMLGKDMVN
jgi:hypothetical protein